MEGKVLGLFRLGINQLHMVCSSLLGRQIYDTCLKDIWNNQHRTLQHHMIGIVHSLEYFLCQWDMLSMSFV